MTPTLRLSLLSLAPLLALAACTETPYEYFVWRKHAEVVEFAPEPLYCYRTLARSDCYSQPLERDQSDRIVGYYGPPPGRGALPILVPAGKTREIVDHQPLIVPREQVESAPLTIAPAQPIVPAQPIAPAQPGGPIPLTRTP